MELRIYPPTPVSVQVPPIQYLDNGIPTPVEENKGLPSLAVIYKNGVQVPVTDSDADPNEVVAIPVVIKATDGTNVTIKAGDINVQTSDMGPNFDSQRIGDGSGSYLKVEADGSINANSDNTDVVNAVGNVENELFALNQVDFATEATLNVVKTATENIAGVDFATEATLSAVDSKLANLSLESTQASILSELETLNLKDFATESTLNSVDTKLDSLSTLAKQNEAIAKLTEIDTAIDAMSAKLPVTLGQKARAASLAATLSTEDVALLTQVRDEIIALKNSTQTVLSVDTKSPTTSSIQTYTPPAGTKQMQIINNAGNTAAPCRWVASAQTPTVNVGALLVPSAQSPLLPAGEIKIIATEGTANVSVAWFG